MSRKTLKQDITNLPDAPGVYFFLAENKKILYIGRATSLNNRVRSYFAGELSKSRNLGIVKMVGEIHSIDHKETGSVLEAILLETDLIKKFQPKYNTREKDDKSYNCAVITGEDFPQVLMARAKDIDFENKRLRPAKRKDPVPLEAIYGPFTQGASLTQVLKLTRKIFPYRDDKCAALSGRPCFSRQIGLCPGTCTGEINKKEYKKTMRKLKLFFEGRFDSLAKKLEREMKRCAARREFEQAGEIKRTLFALRHIEDVSLIKRDIGGDDEAARIEAYDVAHLGGADAVGVMVVLVGGVPDKNSYRKFRIRTAAEGNDIAAIQEILRRRFTHPEWPYPDILVVDGGRAQLNAAIKVLEDVPDTAPVILSVVKDDKHKPREILGPSAALGKYRQSIILANAEAHRFAINYHRKRSRNRLF